MRQGYTHLFSVPADGGTARALTSGRWNVGARFDGLVFGAGYDWTPDGRTIVFDGLQDTTWDRQDRKSTRLNSSHTVISYAVFCLKKKKKSQTSVLPCQGCSNTTGIKCGKRRPGA